MMKKLLDRLLHREPKTWLSAHFGLILVLSAAIFVAICLIIGLNQSVWFDEAYSIIIAKQPIAELLRLTALDTHPPLYYILLKAWAELFGYGELALRSFSALAAGGAVIFAGLLVRRLFGARSALITLPFIVLAPFLLRYGFEIRMYALASLICTAATYVLVRALQEKNAKNQWALYILYAVLVAVGVYTLYYTVLLWLTHLIWLIWMTRSAKQPIFKSKWMAAYIGSVALFLPWLPTFFTQITNGALAPISQPMTLDNLIGILSFSFVYEPVWQLDALLSLLMVFVIVTVSYIVIRGYKMISKQQRPYLVLLMMYIAVPVIILTLVSLIRPMYVERYLAHVLIGLMLTIGVTTSIALKRPTLMVRGVAALLLVILVVGVAHLAQVGNYNFQRLQKPDIEVAATQLADCSDTKKIIAADPYVAIELSYYVKDCPVLFYSETAKMGGGYAVLSESDLRIGDTEKDLSGTKALYYVHYDEAKLAMPLGLREISRHSYGSLTVAEFSAE